MKIIHCADIHLGSQMANFPKTKRERREREIRETFRGIADYARQNNIKIILLAGDIFDRDTPYEEDKRTFYKIVESFPEINFYYLRGNHDGGASYTCEYENLKTFKGEWTSYSLGENVVLYGLEINKSNIGTMYATLQARKDDINLVMLHGNVGSGEGNINIRNFKDKNIDYLALGHYHSFKTGEIDERGIYAYSGCIEGRGFDELGEKGFAVYDTDIKKVEFVPFAKRIIKKYEISVTGAQSYSDIKEIILSRVPAGSDNMVRVELSGEVEFVDSRLESEMESDLQDRYYAISIKDNTVKRKDFSDLAQKNNLKGEFVRLVLSEDIDADTKQRILDKGVNALSGEKV